MYIHKIKLNLNFDNSKVFNIKNNNIHMIKQKKGVSPVVSTVLLIMVVVILAIIILLWSLHFIKEVGTKQIGSEEKQIDQWCSEIQITPIVNDEDGSFGFQNTGNVPIFEFNVKTVDLASGDSSIERVSQKVNPGYSIMIEGYNRYDTYKDIWIIPVLLGKKQKTANIEPFECQLNDNLKI